MDEDTVNVSSSSSCGRAGGAEGGRWALRCRAARSAGSSADFWPRAGLSASACLWRARHPAALPCACSGARETLGIPCAPHKERIGVSFTVCICNICRVVLWPTALVLVCMMSMCNRSWQVASDILCVALVVCVPRTSRESFASTRACARGPRTFMANTACIGALHVAAQLAHAAAARSITVAALHAERPRAVPGGRRRPSAPSAWSGSLVFAAHLHSVRVRQ